MPAGVELRPKPAISTGVPENILGQTLVLFLLRRLGGKGTAADIKRLARQLNPTLHLATSKSYIYNKLNRLRVWGDVDRRLDPTRQVYIYYLVLEG